MERPEPGDSLGLSVRLGARRLRIALVDDLRSSSNLGSLATDRSCFYNEERTTPTRSSTFRGKDRIEQLGAISRR